jgi:adiponectin receptor
MTTLEPTGKVSQAEQKSDEKVENGTEEHHYIGDYETAPAYMKDNLHITHGYRINFNSPKKIWKSLFMIHNESVNIWSHCLPAMIIIVFLFSFIFFIDSEAMRKSMSECQ